MSMLAEPRKKQKYSLNPRGLDWANDENKFGQKLMERMGWKKGNGLGAKEDGNQECIAVSAKHDSKGVGFSHQQSDNWLSHQDDFAAVLAQLHSQHTDSSTAATSAATPDDVSSLEEKSKSSRRRVHYKKFTQGKDLSNCQGEDLKCIFGKKKNKSNKSTGEDVRDGSSQQHTSLQGDGPADSSENSFGVVTITSTSSIAEYFAKKMASLKKSSSAPSYLDQQGDDSVNASGMKGSDSVSDEEQPVRFCLGAEEPGESSTIDSKRKSKKSKKNKEEKEPQAQVLESSIVEQERVDKKRERKREREMQEETEERERKKNKQEKIEQVEDEDVIVCEPERKKSKKSKSSKSALENTDTVDVNGKCADTLSDKSETIVEVNDDIKIKKKKKNKNKADVNNASNDSVIVCDESSDNITSNDDVIRVDYDVVKIDDDDDDVQNNESLKSEKKSKKRDKSKKKSKC